jgi:FeS assembly SUF system protein
MKQLPVVQTPSASSSAPDTQLTAGMVRDDARTDALGPQIVKAISNVFDPEIPVNIYELGLIYEILVTASNEVGIRMTLTAPACPAAQSLPVEVKRQVAQVPGVADVRVDVVWDPPWDRDRMSDAARLQLGIF